MPARNKKAEAATQAWKKRKTLPQPSNRPKKLKGWSDESMLNAMEAVKDGSSANAAARLFGVPPSTLKDRLSGRVKHGTKSGPASYLSYSEEAELVEFLKRSAELGLGKTKREVFSILERCLKKKSKLAENFNGEGWWTRFVQRHPSLSLRCSDSLSRMRSNAVTKENINNYFDLLEKTLRESDLLDKPQYIYNMDESGMPLDHKQPKRIACKGMRKVHGLSSGNKTQITIVACGNASGQMLPPMVIFKGERFNHLWSKGEVPGTLYGMSENGWIDQELYFQWFEKLFLPNIPPHRPILLLLDGHTSHYTPEALSRAARENIIVFCIPPNTTHVAQPLDVSFFGPLKRHWSSVCHKFMSINVGTPVTKLNFSKLFSDAWYEVIKPQTLVSGYRTTGVYPLDRNAIIIHELPSNRDDSLSFSDSEHEMDVRTETEVNVTPVFSPEQIALFQRRYENGYDLCIDPDYVTWANANHPGFLPSTSSILVDNTLSPAVRVEENLLVNPSPFVSDTLASARVVLSVPCAANLPSPSEFAGTSSVADSDMCEEPKEDSTLTKFDDKGPAPTSATISSESTPPTGETKVCIPTMVSKTSTPTRVHTSMETVASIPTMVSDVPIADKNVTPKRTGTQSTSPLTEFLVIPKRLNKKGKKAPGPARVWTSKQSMDLVIEKERKRKEEDIKTKKRLEREQKRKLKEEEKAIKAVEKKRRCEERMKKIEEKKMNAELKKKDRIKSQGASDNNIVTRSKAPNILTTNNFECGNNECLVCFGEYLDDISSDGVPNRNWVQCTDAECKKWMHEDCVCKNSEDNLVCLCGNVFI